MFRPSDVRRVQAACDAGLPAPFEAAVTLSSDRLALSIAITDPDDASLPVAQASWAYDPMLKYRDKQPSDAEVSDIVASLAQACSDYSG